MWLDGRRGESRSADTFLRRLRYLDPEDSKPLVKQCTTLRFHRQVSAGNVIWLTTFEPLKELDLLICSQPSLEADCVCLLYHFGCHD